MAKLPQETKLCIRCKRFQAEDCLTHCIECKSLLAVRNSHSFEYQRNNWNSCCQAVGFHRFDCQKVPDNEKHFGPFCPDHIMQHIKKRDLDNS